MWKWGATARPLRVLGATLAVGASSALGCSFLTDTSGLTGGASADASLPTGLPRPGDASSPVPPGDAPGSDAGSPDDAGTVVLDAGAGADAAPAGGSDGGTDTGTDAALSYAATVLADAPLAYWRLDETSGTSAQDATGHGYTAAVGSGATWGAPGAITGDTDGAIHLSQDGLDAGTFFDFAGTSPYSLEGWISPEVVDSTYRHLFSKNDEAAPGGREEYGVFVQSSEKLVLERFVAGTAVKTSAPIPPLNKYTYVVATYDGTTLALYVNGALTSVAADARAQQPKAVPEFFGCKAAQNGVLQGLVDEVAIYDHALSAASVAAHWAASGAH